MVAPKCTNNNALHGRIMTLKTPPVGKQVLTGGDDSNRDQGEDHRERCSARRFATYGAVPILDKALMNLFGPFQKGDFCLSFGNVIVLLLRLA